MAFQKTFKKNCLHYDLVAEYGPIVITFASCHKKPFCLFVCLFVSLFNILFCYRSLLMDCRSMRCWTKWYNILRFRTTTFYAYFARPRSTKSASKHGYNNSGKRHAKCQHDSCLGHFYHKLELTGMTVITYIGMTVFVLTPSTPPPPPKKNELPCRAYITRIN